MPRFANLIRLVSSSSDPGSPSAGDTFWNTASKLVRTYNGTIWQSCRPRGYAGMYLTADLNPGASTTTINTLTCTIDPNSDSGWTVANSPTNRLTPPANTTGLWKATVNMRFSSSVATAGTTYRRIQATGVKTSPAHQQILAVSETSGHVSGIELDMGATGQAFDITSYDYYQLDMMVAVSTGNTVYATAWPGPSTIWDVATPGTYMTLERL